MTKPKTYSIQLLIAATLLLLAQLACLNPSRLIPQPGDLDLKEEEIRECLVEEAELDLSVEDLEKMTSSSGKKTSCTATIKITASEEYSIMIKKYIVDSTGGQEQSQWTKAWELVSASSPMDLAEIYYFEHQKDDGTYTEYRYIEKIIAIRVEPGCEDAAQYISDHGFIAVESDFIQISNPCQ